MAATAGQWRNDWRSVVARLWAPRRWFDSFLEAEYGRFLPWSPVFIGLGAGLYLTADHEPVAWPAPVASVLLAALAWLLRRNPIWRAVVLAAFCVALGFSAGSFATWRAAPIPPLPARAVVVTGRVSMTEALPDGARRMTLTGAEWPGQRPIERRLRLRLHAKDPTIPIAGDLVRVRALLRAPADPAYPGAWDLQRDAFYAGSAGGGMALQYLSVLEHAPPSGLAARWLALREGIAARLMTARPGSEGAVAATLLVGQGAAIPEADRAAFRDSGLAHLLAVAGLHIAAVMGTMFFLLRFSLAL
jgi:competence protein ComEC